VFDRNLIFDKLNSLHDQAQNLLFGFKARIVECSADITTKPFHDLIFGVTHLLGIRFAPRIKDLPEQRLWRLLDGETYKHIELTLAGKLNINLIRETWDEMLRLAASIKYGNERASRIVSKLAAASHRNKLFGVCKSWGDW
jgi:TnpA family transposase